MFQRCDHLAAQEHQLETPSVVEDDALDIVTAYLISEVVVMSAVTSSGRGHGARKYHEDEGGGRCCCGGRDSGGGGRQRRRRGQVYKTHPGQLAPSRRGRQGMTLSVPSHFCTQCPRKQQRRRRRRQQQQRHHHHHHPHQHFLVALSARSLITVVSPATPDEQS